MAHMAPHVNGAAAWQMPSVLLAAHVTFVMLSRFMAATYALPPSGKRA